MKNKRILSLGMAVTMLVSVLAAPVNVHADAIEPEDSSQEEDYFDDYDPDCPEYESDGAKNDYVVYIDKSVDGSALFSTESDDCDVIYENDAACICTTDLTEDLAEEINEADIGMHVEPNFMFEAMTDEEDIVMDEDEDASTIESELKRFEQINELEKADESRDMRESWNIRMVHGNQDTSTGKHTVVAVLDSGVDFLIDAPVAKSVNLVTDEQNITYYMADMTGHGSAMADVINRMDPNALIYSVRVLDKYNQAPLSRIIQGIRWCMENDVDVINMSFGAFQESEALQQIIEEATQKGIVFVAAAGNSGDRGVAYPAAYEDVLAVGAVNAQAEKTADSAAGEDVDLVAPGDTVDVQSMLGLYTCVGGTSVATAHVAGAASVLTAQNTENDADLVSDLLKESANYISSESGYGNGLLDLEYALESYDSYAQKREEAVEQGNDAESVALEKNDADLPVFSEEEVKAEALWSGTKEENSTNGHYYLAKVGIDYANNSEDQASISAPAARVFKLGAVAPDDYSMSRLHGEMRPNYITSYRLVTKIALKNGDPSDLTYGVIEGQAESAFNGIKNQISLQGLMTGDKYADSKPENIGYKTWEEVIGSDYTGSDARKAKLRRIFIYGMALHAITDTFAHAAYLVQADGSLKKLMHKQTQVDEYGKDIAQVGADDAKTCPNRFEDAKRAARCVIQAYNANAVGGLSAFCSVDVNAERDYRLGNLMICAQKANYGFTQEKLDYFFKNQSCEDPKIDVK